MGRWLPLVREYAGLASGVIGAFGGVLYVLLLILAVGIYEPLGVSPDEVGLGYTDLLVRTAVAWLAIVSLVLGGVLLGINGLWVAQVSKAVGWIGLGVLVVAILVVAGEFSEKTWWPAALPALFGAAIGWVLTISPIRIRPVRPALKVEGVKPRGLTIPQIGGSILVLLLVLTIVVFVQAADVDGGRLMEGRVPRLVADAAPPPWDAEVVRVTWAQSPQPKRPVLPRCLLYLGQADGTTVFYDARRSHQRALRLPSSSVLIEVLGDAEYAVPTKKESGVC